MDTLNKLGFEKMLMGLIVLVAVLLLPTTANVSAAGNTCWQSANGYGIDTSWRDSWQHSNYLRVNIPHNDFWRVRSIYYDGQRVGPYEVGKVSGDKSSNPGDRYTDLRVSSKWAGYKWSLRDLTSKHWSVEYLCYK